MNNPILVWPYSEAPEEYQGIAEELFRASDAEASFIYSGCDWIAFIPKELEAYFKGFSVDWEGEVKNHGCRVRAIESDELNGFILVGQFIVNGNS